MNCWLLAFLIGVVCGLRPFTGLAAISIAASVDRLGVAGSKIAFLGYRYTPWIFAVLAVVEYVTDQLPKNTKPKSSSAVHPAFACRSPLRSCNVCCQWVDTLRDICGHRRSCCRDIRRSQGASSLGFCLWERHAGCIPGRCNRHWTSSLGGHSQHNLTGFNFRRPDVTTPNTVRQAGRRGAQFI